MWGSVNRSIEKHTLGATDTIELSHDCCVLAGCTNGGTFNHLTSVIVCSRGTWQMVLTCVCVLNWMGQEQDNGK